MISLSDFQPLSIVKLTLLEKNISVAKFMQFWLNRSQYKLRCVTAPISVDSQV